MAHCLNAAKGCVLAGHGALRGCDCPCDVCALPPKNEVLPPGSRLPFPNRIQLAEFQQLRSTGQVTVFRCRPCDSCGKEIPEAYECCSEACHHKLQQSKKDNDS